MSHETTHPPETLRLEPRRAVGIAIALALFALWWSRPPALEGEKEARQIEAGTALELIDRSADQPATFYGNTTIRRRIDVQEAGTWGLEVVARSTRVRRQRARLVLRADRHVIGEVHVVRPGFAVYWLPFELDSGEHFLEVAYDNDRSRFPEDLDLVVRSLRLLSPSATRPQGLPRLVAGSTIAASELGLGSGTLLDTAHRSVLPGGSAGDAFEVERGESLLVDVQPAFPTSVPGAELAAIELRLDGRTCAPEVTPSDWIPRFRCEAEAGVHLLRVHNRGSEVLALSHLGVQRLGAAQPLPAPMHRDAVTPATLVPARDGEASTGFPRDGGWQFYSKGSWSAQVYFDRTTVREITVLAEGTSLEGSGPTMYLLLDGASRARFEVSGNEPRRPYRTELMIGMGLHELTLAFTNDARSDTEDRNLWLGEVQVQ